MFGVVCDINKRIKEMGSSITEVSLHSDNVGYYHCAELILNLQSPAHSLDITLKHHMTFQHIKEERHMRLEDCGVEIKCMIVWKWVGNGFSWRQHSKTSLPYLQARLPGIDSGGMTQLHHGNTQNATP